MSYILDALRRADAERGRGGVPSIHTQQQFTPLEADDEAERPRSRRIGWIAGGLGVVLLVAVAWLLLRPEPAPVVPTAAVQPRAVTPLPGTAPGMPPELSGRAGPATAAVPQPMPEATARAEPTRPVARTDGRATARTEERTPARAEEGSPARSVRAPRTARAEGEAPPRSPPTAPPATNAARPAAGGAEPDRVYAVRELPDDVRRALPAINVNGSTWSNDSASRMLMVGGQIYHEGDSVAPGVALERIKPHSAVLAFRGYRYELTF